jgi:hypothetical protein
VIIFVFQNSKGNVSREQLYHEIIIITISIMSSNTTTPPTDDSSVFMMTSVMNNTHVTTTSHETAPTTIPPQQSQSQQQAAVGSTFRNSSISSSAVLSQSSATTTTTATAGTRYDTFTEAVPLSLSSMAHLNVPLTDGVVDGIIQVIHHTVTQCVNYVRILYKYNNYSYNDITTTPYAWIPMKVDEPNQKLLPQSLQRMNFNHQYTRNAWIYLKSKVPTSIPNNTFTEQTERTMWKEHGDDWNTMTSGTSTSTSSSSSGTMNYYDGIIGRITLMYCTTEPLTPGELDGTDVTDDCPPCILYKIIVEYRSLPPTGNHHAVQAEELSMLSFGGSIDDDVKYGALASLYDDLGKYVLEIYSVRGKKYKFDLMDSTLANGTVPHLPINQQGNNNSSTSGTSGTTTTTSSNNKVDPFLKSLCVTVTDHDQQPPFLLSSSSPIETDVTMKDEDISSSNNNNSNNNNNSQADDIDQHTSSTSSNKNRLIMKGNAVTRMYLTLEGKLRSPYHNINNKTSVTTNTNTTDTPALDLPAFDYIKNVISYAFIRLNPKPSEMVQASPSGHTLLLDPDVAGHVYVNGRYAMTWGDDNGTSASHGTALFGMDLHSIPFWNGRIIDYELMKQSYALLWHEILIDAKLQHLNLASKLLHRLMKGIDPNTDIVDDDDNDDALYDTDLDDDNDNIDVHQDCLESLVLAAPNYDRVGIAAKALATRFAIDFGKMAFPCLSHETEWVHRTLPNRQPIVVPQRLINILRRGGYFDIQKTADLLWFTESRPVREEYEIEIINIAVQYLEEAGCTDVDADNIMIISAPVADNVVAKDAVCRWDPTTEQFFVHEDFLKLSINDLIGVNTGETTPQIVKGYLLGMYIAKAHPVGFGRILARYLVRNKI